MGWWIALILPEYLYCRKMVGMRLSWGLIGISWQNIGEASCTKSAPTNWFRMDEWFDVQFFRWRSVDTKNTKRKFSPRKLATGICDWPRVTRPCTWQHIWSYLYMARLCYFLTIFWSMKFMRSFPLRHVCWNMLLLRQWQMQRVLGMAHLAWDD